VTGALRLDEHGSCAQDLQPQLARESPCLSVVEDEPGVLELEPQAQDLGLAGTEMGGDHALIERATGQAYVDPARERISAVRSLGGDRGRDHDAAKERGQDLELIDPAETDERAGVGYDGWSCHASSAPRSASHSFSVVR